MPQVNIMPDTEDKRKMVSYRSWCFDMIQEFLNGFTSYSSLLKTAVLLPAQLHLHQILGMNLPS